MNGYLNLFAWLELGELCEDHEPRDNRNRGVCKCTWGREACGNRMSVLPFFDPLDLAAFLVVSCLLLLRLQPVLTPAGDVNRCSQR